MSSRLYQTDTPNVFANINGGTLAYPTVEEYVKVFRSAEVMQKDSVKFLKAHFNSPNYTTSASRLAKELGYPNFQTINSLYGKFARKLAEQFGWTQHDMEAIVGYWVMFLFTAEYNRETKEYDLILLPDVVEALKQIGW